MGLELVCQAMVEIFANFVALVLNKLEFSWIRTMTDSAYLKMQFFKLIVKH